jgi:thiol-disulfide isomerase/thioredoxin
MRLSHSGFITGLASICLVLFVVITARAAEMETVDLQIKDFGKAPEISYLDDINETRSPDYSSNKLTAVHFWATWCVPCVDELPKVADAQKQYGDQGFKVVAIAVDGRNMNKVKRFYNDYKIAGLDANLDPTQKMSKAAGITGLPGTIFVDGKGNIVARADGPLDWQSKAVVHFITTNVK